MQNVNIFYKTKASKNFIISDNSKLNILPRIGEKLSLTINNSAVIYQVVDIIHPTSEPFVSFADIYCVEVRSESEYLATLNK